MTLTGRVLAGRYRLLEVIGQGGMAVVYRAQDEMLGRDVAVKVLRPAYAADSGFVERFRSEARHAAGLQHPNIVTIHDTGVDEATGDYIVMNLVEGQDLQRVLERDGALPVGVAVRIGIDTASALQAAHERGIIHRDVKPGNILIDREGEARVADFGIARAVADGSTTTTSGSMVGSAQYASPEQVEGKPVSPQSDIYSLGIVLYEALTGVRPFDGPSPAAVALERLRVAPRPLRELRPDLPASLEAIVMRTLERDPAARHPSAAELAGELERFRIAELGGVRRQGNRARAARTAGGIVTSGVAAGAGVGAMAEPGRWAAYDTLADPEAALVDVTDETAVVAIPSPGAGGSPSARAGTRTKRRRRAIAPIAIAAGLGLAALSIVVLVATANILGLGGLGGEVGGESGAPRASDPAAALVSPSPTPSPSASPSPSPTPSPSPSPTPVATPEPTAPPTPEPTAAPTPVLTTAPTPNATQQPAPGPTAPARDPAETVRLFYDLVEAKEFDAAARLWTRRMRQDYPPEGNINGRFGPSTRIDIDRLRIESMNVRARTAVVSISLTEYRESGEVRRYVGRWDLVRTSSGWLMDEPHF